MSLLVAVDFSAVTAAVVAAAREEAQLTGDSLWLLHAASPEPDFVGYATSPQSDRDSVAQQHREEHRQLQALANTLRAEGIETTALLVQGAAAAVICLEAERLGSRLIVLGSHGHGALYNLLAGSVCESVLKNSDRPVLVIPATQA